MPYPKLYNAVWFNQIIWLAFCSGKQFAKAVRNEAQQNKNTYLSSEDAYLGDAGAPVGLNAPEEESKLFVSGFMSKGLCGGPTEEDIGKFVSSDRPAIKQIHFINLLFNKFNDRSFFLSAR
jgi:hypothetical protein